jgi:cephalosporin-C deacetylase-like acetyl esterase
MKNTMIAVFLSVALILCTAAAWESVVYTGTPQTGWSLGGTITATNAALGVTERTATYVEGTLAATKKVLITTSIKCNYLQLRFRSNGASTETNVYQLYAARTAEDHYKYMGQFTVTQNTQIYSTGIYFGGTIVAASASWNPAIVTTSQADGIGLVHFDTCGYNKFLLVCSSKGATATALYVDYAEF